MDGPVGPPVGVSRGTGSSETSLFDFSFSLCGDVPSLVLVNCGAWGELSVGATEKRASTSSWV